MHTPHWSVFSQWGLILPTLSRAWRRDTNWVRILIETDESFSRARKWFLFTERNKRKVRNCVSFRIPCDINGSRPRGACKKIAESIHANGTIKLAILLSVCIMQWSNQFTSEAMLFISLFRAAGQPYKTVILVWISWMNSLILSLIQKMYMMTSGYGLPLKFTPSSPSVCFR